MSTPVMCSTQSSAYLEANPNEGVCFTYNGPNADVAATTVGSTLNLAITGQETGTSGAADINLFEIVIYADEDGWSQYVAQQDNTLSTDTEHVDSSSAYAMFWYCSLMGTTNTDKDGSGCCLRDQESEEQGGYCVTYDNATGTANTHWMVEADFVSAIDSSVDYLVPSSKLVTQTNSNIGFETFKCEVQVDTWMKCAKLQPWPAASYSGGYRFENGNRAEAYYYDFQATGSARWLNNRTFFLEGALSSLVTFATAFTALVMTF